MGSYVSEVNANLLEVNTQCVRRRVRAVGRKAKRRKAKASESVRLGSKISAKESDAECY